MVTVSAAQKDEAMPAHIAIIMDGNGRWAKARGLPRAEGHRRGAAVSYTHLTLPTS